MNLTWETVVARRMARHYLSTPSAQTGAAGVVAAMCGVHAQVMSAAEISLALRMAGATRTTMRDALWKDHQLVKTFGPRGTVHVLPMRDLPLWTAALATTPAPDGAVPPHAQLTPDQSEAVVEALSVLLAQTSLTAEEMDEGVVDMVGSWAGDRVVPAWYEHLPRWRPAIYTAARRGLLCYGQPHKRKVTYTNPRRWFETWQAWEEEEAAREVVRRFLYAYGPASRHHLARWFAAPTGWATTLLDTMAHELRTVQLEGEALLMLAADNETTQHSAQGLHLLPYFDAFVVGSQPRELLFAGKAAQRALAGGQAGNFPVLIVDGVVAGVWHQRRSGRKIHLTVEPLAPLQPAQQQALQEAAQRIGHILEGETQLSMGKIDVGPHA